MKVRVRKTSTGMYIGEVYGTWENLLFGTERTGWNKVTTRCFTEWGAKLELREWKKKNCPKEFDM